ncbi:MAG: hemerythrin domain-containing protein [Paralcaligenes sp.]
MKTVSASKLLEDQHHEIDRGILGVLYGGEKITAHADKLSLLRLHIYIEEEILFPMLEKTGIMLPIAEMNLEHAEMWPYIEALSVACKGEGSNEEAWDSCVSLYKLLQTHNHKEEDIIYSVVGQLFEGTAGQALATAIEAACIPNGWVCTMAQPKSMVG